MTPPAQKHAADTAAAQGTRPAGVITRTLAGAVDVAVICTILVAIYFGWVVFRLLLDPRRFTWPPAGVWLSITGVMVIGVVYLTFFFSSSGRTVGNALLGTRVVSSHHQILGWTRSFVRALICVVFPIGLFWCLIDRRRRSLQDVILRTAVVYDWTARTPDEVDAGNLLLDAADPDSR